MLVNSDVLSEFSELIKNNTCNPYEGELKVGVDLGTANIVLSVEIGRASCRERV